MGWLVGIGLAVVVIGAVVAMKNGLSPSVLGGGADNAPYPVDESKPYGPRWGARKPPGLPATARKASRWGAGGALIREIAADLGFPSALTRAVLALAKNESGMTLGLPANAFNALPPEQRGGRPLITAWGIYQYNRDAWRRASGERTAMPWEATVRDEVRYPLLEYKTVWDRAKRGGAPDAYAERAVRLWHMAPAIVNGYLERGARTGNWPRAWSQVTYRSSASGRLVRDVIDAKLASS